MDNIENFILNILTFNGFLGILLVTLFILLILLFIFRDKVKANKELISMSFSLLSICFVVFGFLIAKFEESETAEMVLKRKITEQIDFLDNDLKQSLSGSVDLTSKIFSISLEDNLLEFKAVLETDYEEIKDLSLTSFKTETAKNIMDYKKFLTKEITYIENNYKNDKLGLGHSLGGMESASGKLEKDNSSDEIAKENFDLKMLTLKESFYKYNYKNLDQKQKKTLEGITDQLKDRQDKINSDISESIGKGL